MLNLLRLTFPLYDLFIYTINSTSPLLLFFYSDPFPHFFPRAALFIFFYQNLKIFHYVESVSGLHINGGKAFLHILC